ncbi:MAG: DUF6265 family protein [Steroidobacteraceae bacterium]
MKDALRAMLMVAASGPGIASAGDCSSLDALRWLLGDWVADGNKSSFHESWWELGPRTFEGTGAERSKADGSVQSGEALRLVEMAAGVFYISKVTHNELPVAFRLSECDGDRLVFVNPKHDFPRRLEYQRGGQETLTVKVSDGTAKGFTLNFARAPGASAATREVLASEDARFAAMIAANPAEMHRWLAADLEYVHSTGEVENRDQLINSITSGRRRYIAIEPGERRVTYLGGAAAIVQGPAQFRVAAGATPLEFQVRYLAVYVHVDGVWQLHAWQSLRLPEE